MIENLSVSGRIGEKPIRVGDTLTVAFDFEEAKSPDGVDKPPVRTNLLEVDLFVEFILADGKYGDEGAPCLACTIGLIGYDASAIVTSRGAVGTKDSEKYFIIVKDL